MKENWKLKTVSLLIASLCFASASPLGCDGGDDREGSSDSDSDTDGDSDSDSDSDADSDSDSDGDFTCSAGEKTGAAEGGSGLISQDEIAYNVRTPDGYDSTQGYPLIMVYSPAGTSQDSTEGFTGLTPDGTSDGYIVAYANHVSPMPAENNQKLAAIADEIVESWCVDPDRIFVTGHSDGGSTTTFIGLSPIMDNPPAAIAPSAAGFSAGAFPADCPDPIPVFIMHSANDTLFPGYGQDARDFWVGCNACEQEPSETASDGCLVYTGCTQGTEVRYCEGTGGHGSWPDLNASMLEFFHRFEAN